MHSCTQPLWCESGCDICSVPMRIVKTKSGQPLPQVRLKRAICCRLSDAGRSLDAPQRCFASLNILCRGREQNSLCFDTIIQELT